MATEQDILDALTKGEVSLPPARLRVIARDRPLKGNAARGRIDAVIQAEWDRRVWKFAVDVKRLSTPKILRDAWPRGFLRTGAGMR